MPRIQISGKNAEIKCPIYVTFLSFICKLNELKEKKYCSILITQLQKLIITKERKEINLGSLYQARYAGESDRLKISMAADNKCNICNKCSSPSPVC